MTNICQLFQLVLVVVPAEIAAAVKGCGWKEDVAVVKIVVATKAVKNSEFSIFTFTYKKIFSSWWNEIPF